MSWLAMTALALGLVAGGAPSSPGPTLAPGSAPPSVSTPAAPPGRHIRAIPYDPDQLVALHGQLGFEMMIEFSPEEHIDNVAIGDGLAWQVTPNKRANLLFLKPLDASVVTNMTVVTDQRRYAFELDSAAAAGRRPRARTYIVRFLYPQAEAPPPRLIPPPPPPPERRNTRYSISGDPALTPAEVFDDSRFTYFRWPDAAITPAIFAIAGEGGETLVNYGVRGGFLVVEQVAPRFVLRNGRQQSIVFNDGWRAPDPGPDAPPQHARKRGQAPREGKSR
jgi:type IV secretion system protein VirB9